MQTIEGPLICYKCYYETTDSLTHCPRCGQTLRTALQVRRLGWVLVATGAFLVIFMTGLIVLIAYIMAQTGKPGSTTSFTGDAMDAAMVFGIMGLVWVFGLAGLVGGIWQVRYGKRNKMLTRVIIFLGLAFLIIGTLVQMFE